ncbi:MAG TPA: glycine betaine ABC transporter substrate-binding protein [Bacillales bacterium]
MKLTRKLIGLSLLILLIFVMVACSFIGRNDSDFPETGFDDRNKGKIVVGGKDFTEQYLLTKITSIYLKENGYDVEEVDGMKSRVARSALKQGHIDLYWEYTGTALTVYMNQPPEPDPEKAYMFVKERDRKNGLVWLHKTEFNNTYTILMRKDQAREMGIQTISELSDFIIESVGHTFKFATNAEFYRRSDGLKGLEKKYGFHFSKESLIKMNTDLLYDALKERQVDASVGFATDGRIRGYNLVSLKDDQSYFPAYNAAPVVRKETLQKYKNLNSLLNDIADRLDTKTITRLNYEVDIQHKSVTKVAREWLRSQGLVSAKHPE